MAGNLKRKWTACELSTGGVVLVCRLRLKPNTTASEARLAVPVVILHMWTVRRLRRCLLLTHSLNVLLIISCVLLF